METATHLSAPKPSPRGSRILPCIRGPPSPLCAGHSARRNSSAVSKRKAQSPNQVTVVLQVADPAGLGVPLPLASGYVERFGVRSEKVRVTAHDRDGARTTWISLTLDAEANLVALQARSAELPLRETAEIAGRRLADQLREAGAEQDLSKAAMPAAH